MESSLLVAELTSLRNPVENHYFNNVTAVDFIMNTSGVKYVDGSSVISLIDKELLYELFTTTNIEVIVNYLTTGQTGLGKNLWSNRSSVLLNLPLYAPSAWKFNRDLENYHEVIRGEGMFPCPKCGSKDTTISERQTRSADEPTTIKIICRSCNAATRS